MSNTSNLFDEWFQLYKDSKIETKSPPFQLPVFSLSSHLKNNENSDKSLYSLMEQIGKEQLQFSFPKFFLDMMTSIGPGTWNKSIRIFAPLDNADSAILVNLQFYTQKLHLQYDKLKSSKSKFLVHNFDLRNCIIFAQWKQYNIYFAWNRIKSTQGDEYAIVALLDTLEKCPPPLKIADTLNEFMEQICNMELLGQMKPVLMEHFLLDQLESDDEAEEEVGEQVTIQKNTTNYKEPIDFSLEFLPFAETRH